MQKSIQINMSKQIMGKYKIHVYALRITVFLDLYYASLGNIKPSAPNS